MKSLCLIRFGTEIDPDVSLTLGLLSSEPITQGIKNDSAIITLFKTELSMAECREALKKHGHNFVLVDITTDTSKIPVAGFGDIAMKSIQTKELVLKDDEREQDLLYKIKNFGNKVLTPDDHKFLQSRM